jgi:hypothetical protein
MKREYSEAVRELCPSAIDCKPQNYDWGLGLWDSWEVVLPGETIPEYDDDEIYPIMNYRYPLPNFPSDARSLQRAQLTLWDTPLVVVRDLGTEEAFLALTSGGMDLSWEICQAYVYLGYLPPIHFCADLPNFGPEADKEVWRMEILEAALRAHEISYNISDRRLDRILKRIDRGTIKQEVS